MKLMKVSAFLRGLHLKPASGQKEASTQLTHNINPIKSPMLHNKTTLRLLTLLGAGGCLWATQSAAWTIAYDGFASYEEGVLIKDQTGHGGTGFSGDWVETSSNPVWSPPLNMNTTSKSFTGVAHNQFGGVSQGGRHIRTLTEVQTEGVVYASTLMLNIGGPNGSSQAYIHNETPDAGQGETGGLIGGVRYHDGFLQYVDPGAEGETFIDFNPEEPLGTDILWVTKYDIDNGLISHYAYLPGDEIEEGSASYAVEDLPLIEEKQLPVGTVSIAAWDQAVNYSFVRVGTQFRDVAPVPNSVATAPAVRSPMTIDGVDDGEWENVPSYGYPFAHGEDQPTGEADASGSWKAAWDDDNLYLLFMVTDDEHIAGTEGEEDQVEFWTDTNFARNFSPAWPPAYDAHDAQWITRFLEDGSGEGFADRWQHGSSELPASRTDISELGDDSMVVAGSVDDSGDNIQKTVEVSVAWEDLNMNAPVFGQKIGFETQINDRDESTGTDENDDPVFDSNGKLAWADGNNLVWRSPATMGVLEFASAADPIAEYAFDDVAVGDPIDGSNSASTDLWAGPWVDVLGNAAAVVTEPSPFLGQFVHGGNGIVPSGEFSVVARSMNTTFDSGVLWASMVLGNGTGTTQFWMGDGSEFEQGSSDGLTAGVRIHNHLVQVIDTTLSASSRENYVPTSVTPNAPVVVVVQLDYENDKVSYWLFESGEPINPANPAAFYEFSVPRVLTMNAFSGIAVAGENSAAAVSHLRVGDDLPQVIPAPENPYNCPVIVNELHEDITVDGAVSEFAWERTTGLPVDIPWMDGGNNVMPEGPSDYTGSFHTGWFGENLYVAVLVEDDEVLEDPDSTVDSVEIYMDGDNNDSVSDGWPPDYDGVDDYQLVFNLDNSTDEGATITGSWFGNPAGNPEGYRGLKGANDGQDFDGIDWAVSPTESGYILEISMDMTTVPGLDTFLANGLMGFDVAIVDNDSTDQVDEDDNPVFATSHHFYCDDSNWNWEVTAHYGMAHVGSPEPAVVIFDDGSEETVALEGDPEAGDAVMEITTNFTDVAYVIEPGGDWATIDFDPMVGSGEMEFSWSANPGLYARSTTLSVEGATGFNEIALSQEGIAPAGMQSLFPEATPGSAPGSADAFLGGVFYGDFPWVFTDPMNWIYAEEDAAWMYAFDISDFVHTSSDLWPLVYVLGNSAEAAGWKYVFYVEGVGSYLYDFQTGSYSEAPVFVD